MPPKKKTVPEAPSMPSAPHPGDSGTNYVIAIGVLLALFAGTVLILLSSPQGKRFLSRTNAPAAENTNAPEAETPPVNEPAEEAEGLPEGGSVELVNIMDADNVVITDQKIVWRTEAGDTLLVASVNALLPALVANRQALYLFARPTNERRVFFTRSCNGPCDAGGEGLIAFDPELRAFIPLLNVPNVAMSHVLVSPNQRRMAYLQGFDAEGEARELWVYDLVADGQTRLVVLPAGESFTSALLEFDGSAVGSITWIDPALISYKVYRAGGRIPGTDRPRTEVATRTVIVSP